MCLPRENVTFRSLRKFAVSAALKRASESMAGKVLQIVPCRKAPEARNPGGLSGNLRPVRFHQKRFVGFRPIADIDLASKTSWMSSTSLLHRLPAFIPYLKARRAYRTGEISNALAQHARVMRRLNRPVDKTFHGTLLILDHRSSEAKLFFDEVISEIENVDDLTSRQIYILAYCRYYRALIVGDDGEQFRIAVERVSSDVPQLKWILPMPPPSFRS